MKKNVAIPVAVLRSGDPDALAAYGAQDMTLEEIAQCNADTIAHAAVVEEAAKTQYRRDRKAAYPPAGDQLDELWRVVAALAAGEPVPATALAMLKALQDVKNAFPKPVDAKETA